MVQHVQGDNASASAPLVVCENVVKIFRLARRDLVVLQGLDLELYSGEVVAVAGASGSGKTTLLNILGGLDTFDAGEVFVAGQDLARITAEHRVRYRRDTVGYLWQQSGRNLLPFLSMRANVEAPMRLAGVRASRARRQALELLDAVGLSAMATKHVTQLSGGEQQRASLAVALANRPPLLLADEPTGELDTETAQRVFDLMRTMNRELGMTMLIVTHNIELATQADRMIAIRDGRVSSESATEQASSFWENQHESVVIDRVGRLQLPLSAMERIDFRGRGDVVVTDDHVEIRPRSVQNKHRSHYIRSLSRGDKRGGSEP